MLEKYLKSSIAFLVIIIPFVFFFVSENMIFPFITGKNFLFRALIDISLILYVILLYINKDYFVKSIKVLYSYILFLTILLISNIFGSNLYNSIFSGFERMEGYITHIYLFIYFVILVSIFRDKNQWRKVFGFLFFISIPIFTYGFAQLLGQKDFYNNIESNYMLMKFVEVMNAFFPTGQGNGLRIDSTFGNSAYSAVYFMLIFLFASMYACLSNNWNFAIDTKNRIKEFLKDSSYIFIMFFLSIILITEKHANLLFTEIIKNTSLISFYNFFVFLCYIVSFYIGYKIVTRIYNNVLSPYLYLLLSFFSLILLYYTQTRGTYIALLCICLFIIFGIYLNRQILKNNFLKRIITLKLYFFLTAFVGLIIFLSIYGESQFVKNNLFLNRISTINLNVFNPFAIYKSIQSDTYSQMVETFGEATLASRVMNIGMAMDFSTSSFKNFLLGNGQENYSYIFSEYHDSRMFAQEPWFDRAHNVVFDWFTASGILGLMAYLSIFIVSIISVTRNTKFNIIEKYFLSGALIGYFLHNLFVFDSITSYIMFIIIIAYIASQEDKTFKIQSLFLNKFLILIKNRVSKLNKFLKVSLLSFIILIILMFSYQTVILPSMKASATINYAVSLNKFRQDPTIQNNYDNLLLYLNYISTDNTYGKLETLSIILNYLNIILEIDTQDDMSVTEKKLQILNNIHSNLIANINKNYNNEKTYIMLAGFYDNIGQGDMAHYYFEKAEQVGGKKPLTKSQYALSLYRYKKYEEALQKSLEAYNLNKENPRALEVVNYIKNNIK